MNPFEKRATEFIPDDLAFLPYVTPEPLLTYLESYAESDVLYDRLVLLVGAPGSGKTTLARLFLFPTLMTTIRNKSLPPALSDALTQCKALSAESTPLIAGCRIPLESDYRDCWELPYEESLRHALFFALVQSRAVLGWLRGMEEAGIDLSDVKLIPRADAAAALEAIGGSSLRQIREIARLVERDVYGITASLLPPAFDQLPVAATSPYHPFDVIEAFEIPFAGQRLRVKPLVICDDAHVLHPKQMDAAIKWLARREMRVARWILTRLDALKPVDVLKPDSGAVDDSSGFNRARDMLEIWMQSTGERAASRRSFRRIAKDMSERYLKQMPVFARRGYTSLETLLDASPPALAEGKRKELEEALGKGQRRLVGSERRREIESLVDTYLSSDRRKAHEGEGPEIRLMMIRILMDRYLKRVPQSSLFEDPIDIAPAMPLKADSTIRNAAEMHLHHEYERPFFYGFETLCDAASENAEKFLRLAGHLVAQLETRVIRRADPTLSATTQEKLLSDRALRMLEDEDLPERTRVLRLCHVIASECLVGTREPNAPLGEGPNAWGILQAEFDTIVSRYAELARILQSAVAHNMITLVRDYGTKGQVWCLVELSGIWSLRIGLTLKRGQFLERSLPDLLKAIASNSGPQR
jgi:hypothetical protein